MPSVRFLPDDRGELALRALQRHPERRRLPGLWAVPGSLELDLGPPESLRAGCLSPLESGLEPLVELGQYLRAGRPPRRARSLGGSGRGPAGYLYYRWRGEYDAVLWLRGTSAVLGLSPDDEAVTITVLETDGQPALEDRSFWLPLDQAYGLAGALWDDLEALLGLLEIELPPRERVRWEHLGFDARAASVA